MMRCRRYGFDLFFLLTFLMEAKGIKGTVYACVHVCIDMCAGMLSRAFWREGNESVRGRGRRRGPNHVDGYA